MYNFKNLLPAFALAKAVAWALPGGQGLGSTGLCSPPPPIRGTQFPFTRLSGPKNIKIHNKFVCYIFT